MQGLKSRVSVRSIAIAAGLGLVVGLAPQAAFGSESSVEITGNATQDAVTTSVDMESVKTEGAASADKQVGDGATDEAVIGNEGAGESGDLGSADGGPAQEGPSDRGPAEGGQAGDAADGERPADGSGPLVEGGSGQAGDAAHGPQGSPTPSSPESQAGQPATDAADGGSVEASEPDAPAGDGLPSVPPRQQAASAASDAGPAASNLAPAGAAAAADPAAPLPASGWVVEDRGDGHGLQRYYIGSDGREVTGLFQAVIDGVASWFYGREDTGFVVRGKWDSGRGFVYLADNDGRLASGSADGWLVTGAYDGGTLQRYWVDGSAHAARSSYFQVGSQWYFGLGGEGYVLRGYGKGVDGAWLSAGNDGRLAQDAWVVTDAFGQGFQRYWFDSTAHIAKEGLVNTGGGWWAYVTGQGYVLRGKLDNNAGRVYLADNDGRLASVGEGVSGWLVTGLYDGGTLQRYWIDGASHAAASGFFTQTLTAAGQGFFGVAGQGYVLRGTARWGDQVLLANNDGVMAAAPGWLVSNAYGQGLQRYWIEGVVGQAGYYAAKTGFFTVDGNDYYGRAEGYVLRGAMVINGQVYTADNDGVILRYLNGIDISHWQGDIDLSRINADFVFMKATQGNYMVDSCFKRFADQALSLGMRIGLYHFVDTSISAEEQAQYFIDNVQPYIGQAVLMLDWENSSSTPNNLNAGPAFAKRFLDYVYEKTGVRPLVYMSRAVVHSYDWSSVADSGYGLWVARYLYSNIDASANGYVSNPSHGTYQNYGTSDFGAWGSDVTMYQYTSSGRLDGYSGNLDLDVFYGSGADWDKLASSATRAIAYAANYVASGIEGAAVDRAVVTA